MSRLLVTDIAHLYNNGWRPFAGSVVYTVYDTLPCGKKRTQDTQQSLGEDVSAPNRATGNPPPRPTSFFAATPTSAWAVYAAVASPGLWAFSTISPCATIPSAKNTPAPLKKW